MYMRNQETVYQERVGIIIPKGVIDRDDSVQCK